MPEREKMLEILKNESVLEYCQRSMGAMYGFPLPAAAFFSFVLVLLVVIRGRGPTVGPALVLLVPMPVYLGLLGTLDGLLAAGRIMEQSGVEPELWALGGAGASSLVTLVVGTMLTIPAFLTGAIGAFVRAMIAKA